MSWFKAALTKYATFSGRARRKEFWYFTLFNTLFCLLLLLVDSSMKPETRLFSTLYILATLLPSVAVTVRRLHDTGHNGWWYFLNFIPVVGPLILLVFCVLDSDPGTNEYGENPKDPLADAVQVFS